MVVGAYVIRFSDNQLPLFPVVYGRFDGPANVALSYGVSFPDIDLPVLQTGLV